MCERQYVALNLNRSIVKELKETVFMKFKCDDPVSLHWGMQLKMEIVSFKNTIYELKFLLEEINSISQLTEEKKNKFEDVSKGIMPFKEQRLKLE